MKQCGLYRNKWQNYLINIGEQLQGIYKNIYKDKELEENAVCSFFLAYRRRKKI